MRIYLTGASGFVGSNLADVFRRHGAELIAPSHAHVDLTDAVMVKRSVCATRPDAVVHAAIWNDPAGLLSDRDKAWANYVEATKNLVQAANRIDAHMVLISSDWVFDGTQGPATENDPPNPINTYGFLKASSELIWRAPQVRATGVLHCCGGEHADRVSLAERAVETFALDRRLLDVAPPPQHILDGERAPHDTRLDATATAERLGVVLPDLETMLGRLRAQLEERQEAPCPV